MHSEIIPSPGRNSPVGTLETSADAKESEAFAAAPLESTDAGSPAGLVNCAKTEPAEIPDDVSSLLDQHFRFPSGHSVRVAAQAFPVSQDTGRAKTATRVPGKVTRRIDQVDAGGLPWVLETSHYEFHAVNESREGPWPTIEVAPGLVRLRRTDPAKRDRQMNTLRNRDRLERDQHTSLREFAFREIGPLTQTQQEHLDAGSPGKIGVVTQWSQKSQVRMQATIRELDLHAFLSGQTPAMTTLTVPGPWGAIMPDAATASKIFHRFAVSYRKMWGTPCWLWKREFQRRGAPHWHLWMIPPTLDRDDQPTDVIFREWVRYAWAAAMGLKKPVQHTADIDLTKEFVQCECREKAGPRMGARPLWCASVGAGTNVDFAEGVRASDPQRLATYFLKESAGSTGKQYQNSVPWAWCVGGMDYSTGEQGPQPRTRVPRASVGRFWGRSAGLEKVLASASVEPDAAVRLWRSMQKAQWGRRCAWVSDQHGVIRTGVQDGVKKPGRVIRRYPVTIVSLAKDHAFSETEYVRRRPVNRVRASSANAGWIGVNNGPKFALDLARFLTGEPNIPRPPVPAAVPGTRRAYLQNKHRPAPVTEIWETF